MNNSSHTNDNGNNDKATKRAKRQNAIAKADAIRARIRDRIGKPLPSSAADLRALREERSRKQ